MTLVICPHCSSTRMAAVDLGRSAPATWQCSQCQLWFRFDPGPKRSAKMIEFEAYVCLLSQIELPRIYP